MAADESGWNGEDLYRPDEPYMAVGSVAIDDAAAAALVANLRAEARIIQAGELKFNHFASRARRLEVLVSALGQSGGLGERAGIYLVDKRYFIVAGPHAGQVIGIAPESAVTKSRTS